MEKQTNRFILLPATNTEAAGNANPQIASFLGSLSNRLNSPGTNSLKLNVRNAPKTKSAAINLKVIDSIHEDGAKLVEMHPDQMADFRFSYPGLRIVPEKFYTRPPMPFQELLLKTKKSQQTISSTISVTDKKGKAIAGADVVAFTDFEAREGAGGKTDASGKVKLDLISNKIQRLYIYPEHSYWGFFKKNFTLGTALAVKLIPIDLAFKDSLRFFYNTSTLPSLTSKVKVGVIDTGVGPHKDLTVAGGANTIEGEDKKDFGDNGEGHGTHVAGIIAAHGDLKGVAVGVDIFSYRVFPKTGQASNFYIMKAIKKAIEDDCDLINMSLGSKGMDEGLTSSIKDAYDKGVLCFAANGNDDRSPVSFPAAYSLSIAVSAMGRKGTFPTGTVQKSAVKAPYGKDNKNFIADFSNIGPETDITAPGVGIISTFPGDRYAVMDGTSMACPAAVGMAARLLSGRPDLLALPKNQQRTDEMLKFLSVHIKSLGFNAIFEGKGMFF